VDVGVLTAKLLRVEILPEAFKSGLNSIFDENLEALLASNKGSDGLECLENVVVDLQLIEFLVLRLNVGHILQR